MKMSYRSKKFPSDTNAINRRGNLPSGNRSILSAIVAWSVGICFFLFEFPVSNFVFRFSPFPTSLPPPLQSSPAPSNTPAPSPHLPAHTQPTRHRKFPEHSSSHPQNSKPHTHTPPRHPTIPHNQTISASPPPPPSHDPQNSHNQTPPTALSAPRSETEDFPQY